MKKTVSIWLAGVLSACDRSEAPPKTTDSDAAIPTAEERVANPGRLEALHQQRKTDRSKLGDVLWNRVTEATRKRSDGDGEVPYTPPTQPPKFREALRP